MRSQWTWYPVYHEVRSAWIVPGRWRRPGARKEMAAPDFRTCSPADATPSTKSHAPPPSTLPPRSCLLGRSTGRIPGSADVVRAPRTPGGCVLHGGHGPLASPGHRAGAGGRGPLCLVRSTRPSPLALASALYLSLRSIRQALPGVRANPFRFSTRRLVGLVGSVPKPSPRAPSARRVRFASFQ